MVKPTFREVLYRSHVAAITTAILFFWFLDAAFRAVWLPFSKVGSFLLTAVAILDIPYVSPTLTTADRMMLLIALAYLYSAGISLLAAWLLSRWVYGMGPLATLEAYRSKLSGAKYV